MLNLTGVEVAKYPSITAENIYSQYRKLVYKMARQYSFKSNEFEDIIQGFIVYLLQQDLLEKYDQRSCYPCTYIYIHLKRYIGHLRRGMNYQKRQIQDKIIDSDISDIKVSKNIVAKEVNHITGIDCRRKKEDLDKKVWAEGSFEYDNKKYTYSYGSLFELLFVYQHTVNEASVVMHLPYEKVHSKFTLLRKHLADAIKSEGLDSIIF